MDGNTQRRPDWIIQVTPLTALLLIGAVVAWGLTVFQAHAMGNMPGTMGMSLLAFVMMWTLMMAAMMLPSVTPLASRYVWMIESQRGLGLASFTAGYLGVWAASGLAAFFVAWIFGKLAYGYPTAATAAAVVSYAACGVYQFSPLKYKCLAQCRAPFSLLLTYASWRGSLRHLRVGAHHGAYCLGCCWSLMVLMFVFGVMNVGAMLALTIVIALEKVWTKGEAFPRAVGLICFVLAVAVIWLPGLAPALMPGPNVMSMTH